MLFSAIKYEVVFFFMGGGGVQNFVILFVEGISLKQATLSDGNLGIHFVAYIPYCILLDPPTSKQIYLYN